MPAPAGSPRTRSSVRPTPRAAFLFALSLPPALIIVVSFPAFWYAALYLPATVLSLTLADLLTALPNRRLYAECSCPTRLFLGQRSAADVALESDAAVTRAPRIEALLEQRGEADPSVLLSGVMENGELKLELPLIPHRRGKLFLDALWLRWRGPLGLTEIRRRQPLEQEIDVMPDVRGIHEAALEFFSRDAVYGVKTQRMRGGGTEFETLCEYAPGMDNRFIDWKHSARHRKLLCKEFRQERNHQIVLGFDTGHLMTEPVDGMPKLDHAIKAGLLLSWISLRNGDLAGGCGFDLRFRHYLKPGRGMPFFRQFQRFTAGLDYHGEETNFTLGLAELNARLQRRALVVLFTEFVDAISAELLLESLRLMARKHVIVFVTMRDSMLARLQGAPPDNFAGVAEAVIAGDFLRERAIVFERIARMGIHCLDVPVQRVSTTLINRYLMIKQRGLL